MRSEEQAGGGAGAARTLRIPTTATWTGAAPERPGRLETEEGGLDLAALAADTPDDAAGGGGVADGGSGAGGGGGDGGAGAGRAPGAGRRRRRRPLVAALVVLLVLAAGLAGGAVWAEGYARNRITSAVDQALPGLSQDAAVSTEEPVLPQVVGGTLRRIDVEASSLSLGPVLGIMSGSGGFGEDSELVLQDFEAAVSRVGVSSPHRASSIQVTGTVEWDSVTVLMRGSSQGLEGATASAGRVGTSQQEPGSMIVSSTYYGVDAQVELRPSVTPQGDLLLSATTARIGSQEAVNVSGDAQWLRYVGLDSVDKEIPMGLLPEGLELTSAVVAPEGLRLTFGGRNVDLADL